MLQIDYQKDYKLFWVFLFELLI